MNAFPEESRRPLKSKRELREFFRRLIQLTRNQTLAAIRCEGLPSLGSRHGAATRVDGKIIVDGQGLDCSFTTHEPGRLAMSVAAGLPSEPLGLVVGPMFKFVQAKPFRLTIRPPAESERGERRDERRGANSCFALSADDGSRTAPPLYAYENERDQLTIEADVADDVEEADFLVEARLGRICQRRLVRLRIIAPPACKGVKRLKTTIGLKRIKATIKELGLPGADVTVRSVDPNNSDGAKLLLQYPGFTSLPFEFSFEDGHLGVPPLQKPKCDGTYYFDFRFDQARDAIANPNNGCALLLPGKGTAKSRRKKGETPGGAPKTGNKERRPVPDGLKCLVGEDLLEAIKRGERSALEAVFLSCQVWLREWSRRYIGNNKDDADVCLQDAFLAWATALQSGDVPCDEVLEVLYSKMGTSVSRLCKSRKRRRALSLNGERNGEQTRIDPAAADDGRPVKAAEAADDRALLCKLLPQIRLDRRNVFVVYYLWPLSAADGIAVLGEELYLELRRKVDELSLDDTPGEMRRRPRRRRGRPREPLPRRLQLPPWLAIALGCGRRGEQKRSGLPDWKVATVLEFGSYEDPGQRERVVKLYKDACCDLWKLMEDTGLLPDHLLDAVRAAEAEKTTERKALKAP
jgi:DNA-directed RNA polymerase specialized sigma24 family protein